MISAKVIVGAALVATISFGISSVSPAAAEYDEYAMNGTFAVVSNGEQSRMNDRYQDQPTVRSTWAVTSTCTTSITCSGKVTSSLGWTEDIYTATGNIWYVRHAVPQWIPCADGTSGPGLQVYKIYPANPEGLPQAISDLWMGEDQTTGVSGNCGRSRALLLTMPVKITKIA